VPVTPEVAQDTGDQTLECNPGNGVIVSRQRGEWTLQRRVGDMRPCMRSNVEMASDGTAIQSMDDDGWLVLESEAEGLHRLVITAGAAGLEYDWSIDGRPEAFDDEAEEWRNLMLTVMDGLQEMQDVLAQESSLRGQIAVHRGHVATLRGWISTHRGHVSTLHGDIATHRGHVAGLRGTADMAEALHAAAEALETPEMQEAMADMAELSETLSATTDDWTTLADNLREIESLIEEHDPDGRIREIEARMEEFDADRRMDEIERSLQDGIAALRRLTGSR
jgi:hypothetical protein